MTCSTVANGNALVKSVVDDDVVRSEQLSIIAAATAAAAVCQELSLSDERALDTSCFPCTTITNDVMSRARPPQACTD